MSWLVCSIKANTHSSFRNDIDREGLSIWYPVERCWTKPKHKRRPILIERPAFGRYVFVSLPKSEQQMMRLRKSKSLLSILTIDGYFAVLPSVLVEALMMRWSTEEVLEKFKIGSLVSINAGVLAGQEGKIVGVSNGVYAVTVGNRMIKISVDLLEQFAYAGNWTRVGDPVALRRAAASPQKDQVPSQRVSYTLKTETA